MEEQSPPPARTKDRFSNINTTTCLILSASDGVSCATATSGADTSSARRAIATTGRRRAIVKTSWMPEEQTVTRCCTSELVPRLCQLRGGLYHQIITNVVSSSAGHDRGGLHTTQGRPCIRPRAQRACVCVCVCVCVPRRAQRRASVEWWSRRQGGYVRNWRTTHMPDPSPPSPPIASLPLPRLPHYAYWHLRLRGHRGHHRHEAVTHATKVPACWVWFAWQKTAFKRLCAVFAGWYVTHYTHQC